MPVPGQRSDAIVDPVSRAFLVVVRSTGGVGDQVRLSAIGRHPKKPAQGGGLPFTGADVARSGDRIRVSVLDLYPPDFTPDGIPYAIAGVGTYSCANIRLYAPLPADATIVDASTGRPIGPSKLLPGPRQFSCPNVRPGQRVDIPWGKTLR
jgi:hypothetical protein